MLFLLVLFIILIIGILVIILNWLVIGIFLSGVFMLIFWDIRIFKSIFVLFVFKLNFI